jgi:hypothetical protein
MASLLPAAAAVEAAAAAVVVVAAVPPPLPPPPPLSAETFHILNEQNNDAVIHRRWYVRSVHSEQLSALSPL